MKLTAADIKRRNAYLTIEAKRMGNLHERMRYLVKCLRGCTTDMVPEDFREAVYDLETEVMFYAPASPPFAKRTALLSDLPIWITPHTTNRATD
jgi:hypothetical protein